MTEQKREEDFNVANLLQAQRDLLAGVGAPAVQAQVAAAPQAVPGAAPAASAEDADAYINLKHYAYVVYGRKWVVLLAMLLVIAAALAYWFNTEQKYEAVAKVDINESTPGAGAELFGGRASYVDTEVLTNLSRKKEVLLEANRLVPEKLRQLSDQRGDRLSPEEKSLLTVAISAAEEESRRGAPLSAGGLGVQPDKYSLRISVQAEGRRGLGSLLGPDRNHAAAMVAEARAKAMAEALCVHFDRAMSNDGRKKNLDKLIKVNDAKLQEINESLIANAVPAEGKGGALPSGVNDLINLIQKQEKDLAETEMRIDELQVRIDNLSKFIDNPGSADQQVSPQVLQRLAELHMQLAQIEDRYNPGHPKYQRIKDEIDSLTRIKESADRDPNLTVYAGQAQMIAERRGSRLEMESLKARKEALEKRIAENKAERDKQVKSTGLSEQARDQAIKAVEREQQLRQRRVLEDIGQQLRRKLQEIEALASITGKDGASPVAPGGVESVRPLGAGLGQVLGFAVILGLILGALLVLLLEHLDDTVRSELIAQRAANLPVIGRLPLFAGSVGRKFISGSEPRSDVAEIFKVFHNHVRYAAPNAPEKCLLITSPERDEGKSFVATNLALSFALEGNKVCFIDADLRRSRMHERLDVLRPRGPVDAGLCGYLESGLSYENVVLPTDNENLSVIMAGGRASNPPRALRSERMRELLARMSQDFDVVIIDTPPILPVVDAAILASLVRAVIMVARFSSTHLGDLSEASGRMAHVNAPMAGMVINGVHGAMAGYAYGYRYGYRYRYSGNYGYGSYGK